MIGPTLKCFSKVSVNMSVRWKDDHTLLILIMMRDQPCLWNTKTAEYKEKSKRDKALENIVKELDINDLTVDGLKMKIKSIRTRYSTELAKIMKSERSGAETGHIYVPKLFWFAEADSFLRAVCFPRSTTATKIKVTDESQESVNDNDCDEEGMLPSDSHDGDLTDNDIDLERDVVVLTPSKSKGSTPKGSSLRKPFKVPVNKKQRLETRSIENAIDKLKQISDANKPQPDTEFDVFCRSLAIQLNKMPLNRALTCQEQLQNVMTRERMYQYQMAESSSSVGNPSLNTSTASSPNDISF